jgi:DNA (cytosine-5)-methyltransferase 1
MIADLFAGGGGASLGIERALGRSVDLAVNHNPEAIAMHAANHPTAHHMREDVWAVNPVEACAGRPVELLWASPDCRHFSRAKGGKPVSPKIRSLAWVVTRWARAVRPAVICLENVAEFQTWGPLSGEQPIKERAGETFRKWVGQLERMGYCVRWRILNAADFGAPTSRRRLFLVARLDGQEPVWPTPTHGPGRALPYRTAAECIDWFIPCPSIFDRKKPLAEATLLRIAHGVMRYVVNAKKPFILNLTHGGRCEPIDEGMRTVTGAHRGEKALVVPTLIQTGYGERSGQAPRTLDIKNPIGTLVGSQKHALVSAFIAKHYGGVVGGPVEVPLGTITQIDHHSLVGASLLKLYGTSTGADASDPMHTVTGQGGHIGLVATFLVKYYGTAIGQDAAEPLDTITTKGRFGLVTVTIDGEQYAIVDIGMRMLQPRELARAQGFPDSYILTGTKTSQVARIGNSVCPDVAEAVVRAQFLEAGAEAERRVA